MLDHLLHLDYIFNNNHRKFQWYFMDKTRYPIL